MCLLPQNEAGATHGAVVRKPGTQAGVFQDRTWSGTLTGSPEEGGRQSRLIPGKENSESVFL